MTQQHLADVVTQQTGPILHAEFLNIAGQAAGRSQSVFHKQGFARAAAESLETEAAASA